MIFTASRWPIVLALALIPAVCESAEDKKAPDSKAEAKAEAKTDAKADAKTASSEKSKATATVQPPAAKEASHGVAKEESSKAAKKPFITALAERTVPVDRTPPVDRKPVEASTHHARPAPVISRPPPPRVVVALARSRAEVIAVVPAPTAPQTAHAAQTEHWSYEGRNGPLAWAKLSPEYAACGTGTRQSPIDIRDGMKVDLDAITFDYRPSGFKVIDNGHTVQANIGGWNSLRVAGRRFKLVQFHFHSPSEEMIDGKQFDMVAHLVHKDGEGRVAVVAVLIESGVRQPAIQTVLNNLPLEKGEEQTASSPIDVTQLLPADRRYFTYMGSLTTPPCTEDVLWIVMKQPVQASANQLNLFARMYPMNARPVQDMGDRVIKESN